MGLRRVMAASPSYYTTPLPRATFEQFAEHRIDIARLDNLAHGEALGKPRRHRFILLPQRLMRMGGDLDIGVVLQTRHQRSDQAFATAHRVVVPVIPVGSLRHIEVPLCEWIAAGNDFIDQIERARNNSAAGFPRIEELLLIDLLGSGMVAHEYQLDFFIAAFEKKVEQQEKALGDVLVSLGHGAGNVHDAEHHRLAGRLWLIDQVVVTQIISIDERYRLQALFKSLDLRFELSDPRRVTQYRVLALFHLQRFLCLTQRPPDRRAHGDSPRIRLTHRTYNVDT